MTNDTWAFLLPTADQGCFLLKEYRRYFRIEYHTREQYDFIIALKHDTCFENSICNNIFNRGKQVSAAVHINKQMNNEYNLYKYKITLL